MVISYRATFQDSGIVSGTTMKFFIDTAAIEEIKDLASTGMVDGVTTNP